MTNKLKRLSNNSDTTNTAREKSGSPQMVSNLDNIFVHFRLWARTFQYLLAADAAEGGFVVLPLEDTTEVAVKREPVYFPHHRHGATSNTVIVLSCLACFHEEKKACLLRVTRMCVLRTKYRLEAAYQWLKEPTKNRKTV